MVAYGRSKMLLNADGHVQKKLCKRATQKRQNKDLNDKW